MKKKYPLKALSVKKRKVKEEYAKICIEMDTRQIHDQGYIQCSSCGRTVATRYRTLTSWGHSHILPKGRFPEHEVNPINIQPRCQNFGEGKGCHNKLDDGDIEAIIKFKDIDNIMEVLLELEPLEYNKMVSKFKDIGFTTYDYADTH